MFDGDIDLELRERQLKTIHVLDASDFNENCFAIIKKVVFHILWTIPICDVLTLTSVR